MRNPDNDALLAQALARWQATGSARGRADVRICLDQPWRSEASKHALEATYHFANTDQGTRLAAEIDGVHVDLDAPIALGAVDIPKPWGREIWFTGIEARGESTVQVDGTALPLSHYLALAPGHLTRRAPLVLLKILDPRPDPLLGDLYFEVHREKQEVYVVTHVDPDAWPDGAGGIRFGMNQALRARYGDDDAFRRAYADAVAGYERVRRRIDAGEAVAAAAEQDARTAMEAFTSLRRLRPGDVVAVPTWLPHSLQHGVRVVEFQTPTYERYILSFAQRVLTQDHWDTPFAVPRMTLDVPQPSALAVLAPGVERIVAFDELRVWRITLDPGGTFDLPDHPSYALCMVVRGRVTIGTLALEAERAAFVPGATLADPARRRVLAAVRNAASMPAVFLIAAPDL